MDDFTLGGVMEVFVAVVLAEIFVLLITPMIQRKQSPSNNPPMPAVGGAWG